LRYDLGIAATVFLFSAVAGASAQSSHVVSADGLTRLSDHAWAIKGGTNIGIVVGDRGTLVVETGLGTPNGRIIAEAAKRLSTKGQKIYVTTTHYHAEHATGDDAFPPDAIVIRPRIQQAELESEGQKLIDIFSARSEQDRIMLQGFRYRKPGILFDKEYRLDLGGVQVRLSWFGPAHTQGDALILVEPDGVLYSGDVVQNKAGPYFYCESCNARSWLAVLDQVDALHPKIIVPDHSPIGDASLIAQERAMLADLQASASALKVRGKTADEATQIMQRDFPAKYPGWTGMNQMALAVQHIYAGP
jgi:glyoxylase-like metal-dependent hydrolase (beta-lactamase superfamily II)